MIDRVRDPNIYKGNSYTIEFDLAEADEDTGNPAPPNPPLEGITGFVSEFDGSSTVSGEELAPIHIALEVALAPRAKAPRKYFGILSGVVITERLFGTDDADFADEFVYVAIKDSLGNALGVERVQCLASRRVPAALL